MPLIVRASPAEPGKKDIFGPWPEDNIQKVLSFARISSKKSKVRKTREVVWVCGKRTPIVLRVYRDGVRIFPRGRAGERDRKAFKDALACLSRSGSVCQKGLAKDFDPKKAVSGRRRKVAFPCPTSVTKS